MIAVSQERGTRAALALVSVGLLLKVALLCTSQSMADGDEAVEGLMAMRILARGIHPIYPWGVNYGAGAGLETHLAALLFAAFGPSDVALKAAGLILWSLCLLLVFRVGRRISAESGGWAAALLFAFSPQAAIWSLKVAGGHLVALLLALLALDLLERGAGEWKAALVLPAAGFAHPIAAPFAVTLAMQQLLVCRGSGRWRFAAALAASLLVTSLLLWPGEQTVWRPEARRLEASALGRALPGVAAAFFSPNLSSRARPAPLPLAVSTLWMAAFVWSLLKSRRDRSRLLWIASVLPVVLLVDPVLLVPRHLLLLYPLSALVMGGALTRLPGPRGHALVLALALAGATVQVREMASPVIYGPDPQNRGVPRAQVRGLVRSLEEAGIRHVYCLDPMLQWNLIFESRERILARWIDPVDREPRYPALVDRARRQGEPYALLLEDGPPREWAPQSFRVVFNPPASTIDRLFPPSLASIE